MTVEPNPPATVKLRRLCEQADRIRREGAHVPWTLFHDIATEARRAEQLAKDEQAARDKFRAMPFDGRICPLRPDA